MVKNEQFMSDTCEIEAFWSLLIEKYLYSLKEPYRQNPQKFIKEIKIIQSIYIIIEQTVKKLTNNNLPWFQKTLETIEKFFPEILKK